MKISRIRTRQGLKLNHNQMLQLQNELKAMITSKGFITGVSIASSSAIRLGLHMRSFVIDTIVHEYNARPNRNSRAKKKYKRTNLPTWQQREQYNHAINDVLDRLDYTASITSGPFVVRDPISGRVHEWNSDYAPAALEIYNLGRYK